MLFEFDYDTVSCGQAKNASRVLFNVRNNVLFYTRFIGHPGTFKGLSWLAKNKFCYHRWQS